MCMQGTAESHFLSSATIAAGEVEACLDPPKLGPSWSDKDWLLGGPGLFLGGGKPAPKAFLLQLWCRHPLCGPAAKCCRQLCVLQVSCAASYLPPLSAGTWGISTAQEAQGRN